MNELVIQEICILLLSRDDMLPLWIEIGETQRLLQPKLKVEDLDTLLLLQIFKYEKEIMKTTDKLINGINFSYLVLSYFVLLI